MLDKVCPEVLTAIVNQVTSKHDLARLCRVSKTCNLVAKPKLYDTLYISCNAHDYYSQGLSIDNLLLERTPFESLAYWSHINNISVGDWTSQEPEYYCIHEDVASGDDDSNDEYSEDHIVDLGCSLLSVLHLLKENCLKSFQ